MSDSRHSSRRKFFIGAAGIGSALAGGVALGVGGLDRQQPKSNGKVALVTGSSRLFQATEQTAIGDIEPKLARADR